MNKSTVIARKLGTRQIAVIGMLSAISITLGLSGYGFIPLPMAKATILHIPVIIGAILEGPIVGIFIGLIFGFSSLLQNLIAPTSVLSFAFINPLVSVVPRVLIAITSYYSYHLLFPKSDRKLQPLKVGIGAAVGSLTNTVCVLSMIYVLYAARFSEILDKTGKGAVKVIWGIALANGVPEAIVAVIISVPVILAGKQMQKR
jgi:uncharacterized membrane protein